MLLVACTLPCSGDDVDDVYWSYSYFFTYAPNDQLPSSFYVMRCFVTEGKPDPPQNLSITGCTESTVGLKWEPPELDGGSPITGYVVEMRPTNKKAWTKVEDTKSLELTASKLSEGTEYVFRVAAQNAVGVGEFVELQKGVIPKGQFGEFLADCGINV